MQDDGYSSWSRHFTEAIPLALAAGMVAIGALLVNIQIQQASTSAAVQQLVKAIEDLRTDNRAQLSDLEQRVRNLETRR